MQILTVKLFLGVEIRIFAFGIRFACFLMKALLVINIGVKRVKCRFYLRNIIILCTLRYV